MKLECLHIKYFPIIVDWTVNFTKTISESFLADNQFLILFCYLLDLA